LKGQSTSISIVNLRINLCLCYVEVLCNKISVHKYIHLQSHRTCILYAKQKATLYFIGSRKLINTSKM
jgi:hypothetical protein